MDHDIESPRNPPVGRTPAAAPIAGRSDTISYFEVGKASVSYADLNLENEEGVRVLYRRLKRASKEVCGAPSGSLEAILAVHEIRRCYLDTLSNAVDDIDNDDLTRIHAG